MAATWPPVNHQDAQDAITELRTAPPAHTHPVADLATTGTKTAGTLLNGVGAWVLPPVVVVGTSASPITAAATTRPAGAVVVYWLCAAGVTPTNAVGADLIWNAP